MFKNKMSPKCKLNLRNARIRVETFIVLLHVAKNFEKVKNRVECSIVKDFNLLLYPIYFVPIHV